jgi:RNA polymerase sigma-70 factor (ECF subfamily)
VEELMTGTAVRKPETRTEAALVARAANGEEAAVRTIIRRYNQRLYRIARAVVRDAAEAEDVLQQAYVQAFTHLGGFRGEARLSTWLSRIVLNEAVGRMRKRRPTVGIEVMDQVDASAQIIPFPGSVPDPERGLAQREVRALLERAIDELPDEFRVVLVARVLEEMSIEETAELLGIKAETVKTRLHRARRLVKGALERELGPALTTAFPFNGWRCDRMADAVVARLRLTK